MVGSKVCRRLWNFPLQQPARAGYYTVQMRVFLSARRPLSARWRRGAAPRSWEPNQRFFVSLVSRWRGSTTGLKRKPERIGTSFSPKSTTYTTGAAWLCATQRCGWSHPPRAIDFSPIHPRAGSLPGLTLPCPQPFPPEQGGTCWGKAPRDPLWPLPTAPVASLERFAPPTSVSSNISNLHSSGSWASPGPHGWALTAVGKGWWDGASTSPSTLPSLCWILGSSAGGAEHFPYPDFAF